MAVERQKKTSFQNTFDSVKLKQIAMSIRSYYVERKVSNLFLKLVVDKLSKNAYGSLMEKSQIEDHIQELVRRCPSWLAILDNSEGKILRLCQSLQLADIYKLADL